MAGQQQQQGSAPSSPASKALPELPMMLNSPPDVNRAVASLVSRFNTLEVKDRDEEAVSKQLRRLESSLRRAEMAREEAESEVRGLRKEVKGLKNEVKELVEVGEEWVVEKKNLKARGEEYEKKYEKAKAHFRTQRTKHDEVTRKMQKDFMEREKQHWRVQAMVEDELEWERKLRHDALELVAFCEVERQIALSCAYKQRPTSSHSVVSLRGESAARADSAVDEKMNDDVSFTLQEDDLPNANQEAPVAKQETRPVKEEKMDDAPEDTSSEQQDAQLEEERTQQDDNDAEPTPLQEQEPMALEQTPTRTEEETSERQTPAEDHDQEDERPTPTLLPSVFDEHTPEPESELPPLSPPKKQTLTVPINFGDDEDDEPTSPNSDKENSAPSTTFSSSAPAPFATPARPASAHSALHKTPATVSTSTFGRSWGREEREGRAASVEREGWNIPGVLPSEELDREAALAAIRERRGRARSFMTQSASGNVGLNTPGKKSASSDGIKTPKRDVSAPVKLATMSVGRAASRTRVR